jgi:hypothetical protein
MSMLSDILSNLAAGGTGTPNSATAAVPQTPVAPNYTPQDAITQQYSLANQLRRVAPARSWAGVAAQGLGAIGGNLVQGDADNALAANQAVRKSDISNAANATDLPSLEKSLITAQTPDIQTLGLSTKIKQITDDPSKDYRVRAAQAIQYGLKPGTPEFNRFVLTNKMSDPNEAGAFGKTGAIVQGSDGSFYSVQFGAGGQRKIEKLEVGGSPQAAGANGTEVPAAPPIALTPSRGVEFQGDTAFDKATGAPVRNIASNIAGGEKAKVVGRETGQGQMNLPKSQIALEQSKIQNDSVDASIDQALKQADNYTTGFTGAITSNIPGTKAHDLANTLSSIKANLGFDKLQALRDSSPTGGALGQVSEQENRLLQSVWGSVEQSQSSAQLKENLGKVKALRQRFQALKQQAYDMDVARFGKANVPDWKTGQLPSAQPSPSAPNADPLAQARDAIAKGADRNAVIQRLQQNGIDPSGL